MNGSAVHFSTSCESPESNPNIHAKVNGFAKAEQDGVALDFHSNVVQYKYDEPPEIKSEDHLIQIPYDDVEAVELDWSSRLKRLFRRNKTKLIIVVKTYSAFSTVPDYRALLNFEGNKCILDFDPKDIDSARAFRHDVRLVIMEKK